MQAKNLNKMELVFIADPKNRWNVLGLQKCQKHPAKDARGITNEPRHGTIKTMSTIKSETARAERRSRSLDAVVRMRPLARGKVMAKLPTAYCQRIMEKYCVFTGTKINLCLAEGHTRKEAWENAAAS